MHSPDVIVIGAGTNGLAAAAALAKAGVDTLVLEKRARAGGLSSYHAFTPENHIPGFRPYPGRIGGALSKALGLHCLNSRYSQLMVSGKRRFIESSRYQI